MITDLLGCQNKSLRVLGCAAKRHTGKGRIKSKDYVLRRDIEKHMWFKQMRFGNVGPQTEWDRQLAGKNCNR